MSVPRAVGLLDIDADASSEDIVLPSSSPDVGSSSPPLHRAATTVASQLSVNGSKESVREATSKRDSSLELDQLIDPHAVEDGQCLSRRREREASCSPDSSDAFVLPLARTLPSRMNSGASDK